MCLIIRNDVELFVGRRGSSSSCASSNLWRERRKWLGS